MSEVKTISSQLNHLLRLTLEQYKPVLSPSVNFFAKDNIYASQPGLIFCFENASLQDYTFINNMLISFHGLEKWICHQPLSKLPWSNGPIKNYVIETESTFKLRLEYTKQIDEKEEASGWIQKSEYQSFWNENEGRKLIDRILEDYPLICTYLEEKIHICKKL